MRFPADNLKEIWLKNRLQRTAKSHVCFTPGADISGSLAMFAMGHLLHRNRTRIKHFMSPPIGEYLIDWGREVCSIG
jgi:hypothetical protein